MPGALPDGEPVPVDGTLPSSAIRGLGERPFGIYVHVPFCTTRCGYCDFNTYTAAELGGTPGAAAMSVGSYPEHAIAEIRLARKVLAAEKHRADIRVGTVFFGGGTPTLMPPAAFGRILRAIDAEFGLAPDAEVTTEANPESVDEASLAALRAQGVTRVSFGMQSAVPGVLAVLDRVHRPGRPARCAGWARAAGFEHVSLDLIYGAPGETDADWRRSLAAAIAARPDHVSAYALTVEPGTRLAARVRRGELPAPDDDVLAERYLIADEMLTAAGLGWYEISNWAGGGSARCAHNMLYWTGGDWWGIGPGAHSHVGGTRWWNVRHPVAYGARIGAGLSPGQAREILGETERQLERVMLLIRLADGCPVEVVSPAGRANGAAVVAEGLADPAAYADGRIVLTSRGRLLADTVTRLLTELGLRDPRADPGRHLVPLAAVRGADPAEQVSQHRKPDRQRDRDRHRQRHGEAVQQEQAAQDQAAQPVHQPGERQVQGHRGVEAPERRPPPPDQVHDQRDDRAEEDRGHVAEHRRPRLARGNPGTQARAAAGLALRPRVARHLSSRVQCCCRQAIHSRAPSRNRSAPPPGPAARAPGRRSS
jgi:putative oxygen-independent coproporphyrinogen III oxidase